jgi:hypothetical protein
MDIVMKQVINTPLLGKDDPDKLMEYWVKHSTFDVPEYCAVKNCIKHVHGIGRVGDTAGALLLPLCEEHLNKPGEIEIFDYYLVPDNRG